MVATRQQLVTSASKSYKHRNKGTNRCLYITIHETANVNAGADAAAHANLQSRGNVRSASWHWSVDDQEAVQSFPHDVRCWHAGDGAGNGNNNSIGIEICVNSDGDYPQAVRNAAALVRQIMAQHGIPISNVVQHNNWSGKNCPTRLRTGSHGPTWQSFIDMVRNGTATPVPTPSPKPPTSNPTPGGINVAALPRLKRGSKNTAFVKRMQALLIANGYSVGKAGIDGDWQSQTDAGFRAFQLDHPHTGTNGKPDGVCHTKSWTQLLGL